MPKMYVLRCERNWVLESESGKQDHWLVVVAELGDVLEKVLIDFGKLFQRIGAIRLYERLDILREVVDGWSKMRWLEERGASRFNVDRLSEVLGLRGMKRIVSKRDDFLVDTVFHFEPVQRFEYPGDMFSFGVQVIARAREFCSSWKRDICFYGKFR